MGAENHLLNLIDAARKALQVGDLERCAWLLWLARCEAASSVGRKIGVISDLPPP